MNNVASKQLCDVLHAGSLYLHWKLLSKRHNVYFNLCTYVRELQNITFLLAVPFLGLPTSLEAKLVWLDCADNHTLFPFFNPEVRSWCSASQKCTLRQFPMSKFYMDFVGTDMLKCFLALISDYPSKARLGLEMHWKRDFLICLHSNYTQRRVCVIRFSAIRLIIVLIYFIFPLQTTNGNSIKTRLQDIPLKKGSIWSLMVRLGLNTLSHTNTSSVLLEMQIKNIAVIPRGGVVTVIRIHMFCIHWYLLHGCYVLLVILVRYSLPKCVLITFTRCTGADITSVTFIFQRYEYLC